MYFTGSIIMVPSHDNSSPKQPDLQPGKKKKNQSASSNAGHSQSCYWEWSLFTLYNLIKRCWIAQQSWLLKSISHLGVNPLFFPSTGRKLPVWKYVKIWMDSEIFRTYSWQSQVSNGTKLVQIYNRWSTPFKLFSASVSRVGRPLIFEPEKICL